MSWFSPEKLQVQQRFLGPLSQWPSFLPSAKDQPQTTGGHGPAVLIRQIKTTFKAAQLAAGVLPRGIKRTRGKLDPQATAYLSSMVLEVCCQPQGY